MMANPVKTVAIGLALVEAAMLGSAIGEIYYNAQTTEA